jgi:hypothetical protein
MEFAMNTATLLPPFDELTSLHQKDPAALEALRVRLLREAIDAAPAHNRPALEHLVFLMDKAREGAATPLDAAAAASKLMLHSRDQLHGALEHLQYAGASLQAQQAIEKMRL